LSRILRLLFVGVATSLFNYLVYTALLLAVPATPPLVALAAASAAAMLLSFLGYSRLVFDR
jgi:putative flippase GtrA